MKKYQRQVITYTPENLAGIAERVTVIKKENPGIPELDAGVLEVISRMTGDNGLSEHMTRYLTAAILKVIGG